MATAFTYDADGRVTQTQQTASGTVLRTTSATYLATGKQATATDARGNTTTFTYDLLDRLIATADPAGRVTRFAYTVLSQPYRTYNTAIQAAPLAQQTYTADGLRATLSDANGNATAFTYDRFNRLATTTYPGGSTETATYDADSNILTRVTRAGGTIAYTYDTLNRLITKTPPSGVVVTYAYDLAGRMTGVGDTSSALTSAVPPGGAPSVAYTMAYTYDALNRPTATTYGDVAAASAPAATLNASFAHTYNAVNQRTGQTVTDASALGWIDYPPNAASTTSYTANNLNQYTAVITSAGTVTPTYDGNGNLTSDGAYTLGYDSENRLTSASGGATTATYAYDGRGRRKLKTVNGTTTITITDADNREVLEYDGGTGAVLRWYAYGLGSNDVVGQMNVPAGTRTTPVPDILGSVIASMDAGTGVLTSFAYRPYGGSNSAATPFAFTGQRFDAETGFYYYRARHYLPGGWGRFAQADPIGYDGGMNLYAYASNDPLNLLDPDGQLSVAGVLRFIGGTAEAAIGVGFGIASSWSGVGAVAGGAIALHGIDVAVAAIRGSDSLTSQGIQVAGVSQSTANAIDTGISGVAFIAAGAPVLPYSSFGAAIAGGGRGTSLISATSRGFIVPGVRIEGTVTEASGPVWNALSGVFNTGTNAATVGRIASGISRYGIGYGLEASALSYSSPAYGSDQVSSK